MTWTPPSTLPPEGEWLTLDGIRCLWCGRWYRSLATHIARTHGSNTAVYRREWGIARTTPLVCLDTWETMRADGRDRYESNPAARDALHGPGAEDGRRRGAVAARGPRAESAVRRSRAVSRARADAHLQERLDAAGWGTLVEAVEWARSQDVGWSAVAARLGGMSITPLKSRAAREGLSLPSYRTRQSPYETVRRARERGE